MQIALAMKNSTYDDELSYSLIQNGVIKKYNLRNFQKICSGIEDLATDYYDSITKIVGTFNF